MGMNTKEPAVHARARELATRHSTTERREALITAVTAATFWVSDRHPRVINPPAPPGMGTRAFRQSRRHKPSMSIHEYMNSCNPILALRTDYRKNIFYSKNDLHTGKAKRSSLGKGLYGGAVFAVFDTGHNLAIYANFWR